MQKIDKYRIDQEVGLLIDTINESHKPTIARVDGRLDFLEDADKIGSLVISFCINDLNLTDGSSTHYITLVGSQATGSYTGFGIGINRMNNELFLFNYDATGSNYYRYDIPLPQILENIVYRLFIIKTGFTYRVYFQGKKITIPAPVYFVGSLSGFKTSLPITVGTGGLTNDARPQKQIVTVFSVIPFTSEIDRRNGSEFLGYIEGIVNTGNWQHKDLAASCVGFYPFQERSGGIAYDRVGQFNWAKHSINIWDISYFTSSYIFPDNAYWTYSASQLIANIPAGNASGIFLRNFEKMRMDGTKYRLKFDIVDYVSGTLQPLIGINATPQYSGNGSYITPWYAPTNQYNAETNPILFAQFSNHGFTGKIENIILESTNPKLTGNHIVLNGYSKPVVKTNLFADPGFNAGISGWGTMGDVTLSWVSNRLKILTNVAGGYLGAYYSFATTVGKEYIFSAELEVLSTSVDALFSFMKSDNSTTENNSVRIDAQSVFKTNGKKRGYVIFTATAATSYVWIKAEPPFEAGESCLVDNVQFGETVYEIPADVKRNLVTKAVEYPFGLKGVPGGATYVEFSPAVIGQLTGQAKAVFYFDFQERAGEMSDFMFTPSVDGVNMALRFGGRFFMLNGIIKGLSGVKNEFLLHDNLNKIQYPLDKRNRLLIILTDGGTPEFWFNGQKYTKYGQIGAENTSPLFYNFAAQVLRTMNMSDSFGSGHGGQLNEHAILTDCTLTDAQKADLTTGARPSTVLLADQARVHHVQYGDGVKDILGVYHGTKFNYPEGSVREIKTGLPEIKNAVKIGGGQYQETLVPVSSSGVVTLFAAVYLTAESFTNDGALMGTNKNVGDPYNHGGSIGIQVGADKSMVFNGSIMAGGGNGSIPNFFQEGLNTVFVTIENGKGASIYNSKISYYNNGVLKYINTISANIDQSQLERFRVGQHWWEGYGYHLKGYLVLSGYTDRLIPLVEMLNIQSNTRYSYPTVLKNWKCFYNYNQIISSPNRVLDLTENNLTGEFKGTAFTANELNPAHADYAIKELNTLI